MRQYEFVYMNIKLFIKLVQFFIYKHKCCLKVNFTQKL